ncbi:NUMOD4 domain-containing protein [Paenibacillus sp. Root444D2]|uniref:NUMOD4 domain-containing protein n=1 Tax=Paenibacillus sp. Root444D2 TaxID=1736538 RepID=UPI00070DB906|nr:NUMOD4 domain-containing protein [Paenibacillus sp. Root444D2]KQX45865.1 hypothetical protein ASD40_18690 [Paenibacillus sp. Root444D2]
MIGREPLNKRERRAEDQAREQLDNLPPLLIDEMESSVNDVMSWDAERGFLIAALQKTGHDDGSILEVLRELVKVYKQKSPQFGYKTYYTFCERTEVIQSLVKDKHEEADLNLEAKSINGGINVLDEERAPIKGYEGLYEITVSGRVFSIARNRFREREGDGYGFKWVKLSKDGKSQNFLTKELWEKAFERRLPECDYRGE